MVFDNAQMGKHAHRVKRISAMALCVLLSLLLHLICTAVLVLTGGELNKPGSRAEAPPPDRTRIIRVQRSEAVLHQPEPQEEEQQKRPFAKTSADTHQALPEKEDYEGSRNTRAASAPDAEHLRSEKEAPAQRGEEKEEVVTFDQERREGDLQHEGQQPTTPPDPPLPPTEEQNDREQPETPAPGKESADADTPRPEADADINQTTQSVQSATPQQPEPHGDHLLKTDEEKEEENNAELNATATTKGTATGDGKAPAPPRKQQKRRPVFYDPSLANPQPNTIGFRTHERRSRSSGRFVVGRGAALNVSATPLGRYESEIYRRIAYHWYRACDDHRGDIIPGSITISLRINKRGQLENMDLVRRHGAGVIQQSFTFRAIRRATLPPMPSTVRQEIVGELLELIFTFNFD